MEDWKFKYFNDVETKEKELSEMRVHLSKAEENNRIYHIQLEEIRKQLKHSETVHKAEPYDNKPNYLEQLRIAQQNLLEHNEKINQLLENIEVVKENEEKQQLIEEENEILIDKVKELKYLLSQKETEINNIRQQEHLAKEMTSMLDNAYSEFNTLQSKIQKLESQVSSSRMINLEYEDLKEAHYKTSHDYEDQKIKLQNMSAENKELTSQLEETEDKLREANFQRQQLQKKVSYLEELNNDLQMVADANKKLENQLRRIGELESMINVVSEENQVLKRQGNP